MLYESITKKDEMIKKERIEKNLKRESECEISVESHLPVTTISVIIFMV